MKLLNSRWLLLISVVGMGAVGIVSSNVGCGSSGGGNADGAAGAGGHGGHAGTGDAAAYASKLNFTFDADLQGWALSTYPDKNYFNFGVLTDPALAADAGYDTTGKVAPTFVQAPDDMAGVAGHGSAKVTVNFTDFLQYVDPTVNLATPVDLSTPGVFVYVGIKLVSGTFNDGGIQIHLSSGSGYVYAGQFFPATSLHAGQWVTLAVDQNSIINMENPPRTFDPSQVIQLGVQFTTGSAFDGGAPPAGEVVFEIDTVVDKKPGT